MTDQTPGTSGPTPEEPHRNQDSNSQPSLSEQSGPWGSSEAGEQHGQQSGGVDQGPVGDQVQPGQPPAQPTQSQPTSGYTAPYSGPVYPGSEVPGSTTPYAAGQSPYAANAAAGAQQPGQPDAVGPHTYPQMSPVYTSQQTRSGGGKGKLFAAVTALALVVGLIAGGIGGYFGSRMAGFGSSPTTVLDRGQPVSDSGKVAPGSVQAVADQVLPSVVQIQVRTPKGTGTGSGIILSRDGYILTNNHVIAGGRGKVVVRFSDGKASPAKVVGTAPWADLAVVKANASGLNPAELGTSEDVQIGQKVVAVGAPFGLSGTVTSGIISAKNRPVAVGGNSPKQTTVLNALQTDAAINPGNSGGPLVNMKGRVIGINSAIYSPSSGKGAAGSVGLGFAIPIENAKRIAKELINTGVATKTVLGVKIVSAQRAVGALVAAVVPKSPAAKGGLRPGDVIVKLDDRVITGADELVAAVRAHAPGDKVTLTVSDRSGNNKRTTTVTLAGQKPR